MESLNNVSTFKNSLSVRLLCLERWFIVWMFSSVSPRDESLLEGGESRADGLFTQKLFKHKTWAQSRLLFQQVLFISLDSSHLKSLSQRIPQPRLHMLWGGIECGRAGSRECAIKCSVSLKYNKSLSGWPARANSPHENWCYYPRQTRSSPNVFFFVFFFLPPRLSVCSLVTPPPAGRGTQDVYFLSASRKVSVLLT